MELRERTARYPERAVAAWLGVPVRRLRASTRLAFGGSRRRYGFRDLIVLRAVEALRRAGVDARRIGRAMREVRRVVAGSNTPLAALRFHTDGRSIVVEWESRRMTPGGQWLLDLDSGSWPLRSAELANAHRALAGLLERRGDIEGARVERDRGNLSEP